ncbi:MAG TPA: hypothetical protein VMF59_03660 [Bacteroidota bacterium]|nr:hypothetical protein [Bacteroidota bacterium]
MNLLFQMLQRYTPLFLRRRELDNLFRLTASAFGTDAPAGAGLSYEQRLGQYAQFTSAGSARSLLESDGGAAAREKLFLSGFAVGDRLRKTLGSSTSAEASEAMRLIYRSIGIHMVCPVPGSIAVKRCFFSAYYTPETCRLISALDDGVFAGLSGGGRLRFNERITEGADCCTAEIYRGGTL